MTRPHIKINLWTAMSDAILSGFVFIMFIMAIMDTNANGIPNRVKPFFFLVIAIGMIIGIYEQNNCQIKKHIINWLKGFSGNCGASLNPARDLGPRLYVAIFKGFEVFRYEFILN